MPSGTTEPLEQRLRKVECEFDAVAAETARLRQRHADAIRQGDELPWPFSVNPATPPPHDAS